MTQPTIAEIRAAFDACLDPRNITDASDIVAAALDELEALREACAKGQARIDRLEVALGEIASWDHDACPRTWACDDAAGGKCELHRHNGCPDCDCGKGLAQDALRAPSESSR